MCRLLGIVANEPTEYRIALREAPRSLAVLSRQHPDGWGIAVFNAEAKEWQVDKGLRCAGEDERFLRLASGTRGEVLISHIRKKTVGETTLPNTHPFLQDGWVFAHNGTINDLPFLRAQASAARLAEIDGDTDSEVLFACVLTCLDKAGATDQPANEATDEAIREVTLRGRAHEDFGAFNFVLSNGSTTYAHRFGRSMFLLERGPYDPLRTRRASRDGMVLDTPWSAQRTAIFVASERMTDEPWEEIGDSTLLRIERIPSPHWRLVR